MPGGWDRTAAHAERQICCLERLPLVQLVRHLIELAGHSEIVAELQDAFMDLRPHPDRSGSLRVQRHGPPRREIGRHELFGSMAVP